MAIRKVWKINPKSRIKESGKIYNRQKAKMHFKKQLKEEEYNLSNYISCPKCGTAVCLCPYFIQYECPGINRAWLRCNKCLHCFYINIANHFGE